MKIRIISSKDEIDTITNEEIIHISFRPSNRDIFLLVRNCLKLKAIKTATIEPSIKPLCAKKSLSIINADGCKSKTWPERKAHTIEFIKNAGRDMKLLSCADKLANLRDIIRDYDRLVLYIYAGCIW